MCVKKYWLRKYEIQLSWEFLIHICRVIFKFRVDRPIGLIQVQWLLGGWLRWTITRSQERRITYFLSNHYRIRVFHNNGDRYRCLWGCIRILVLKNIFLISKSDLPKTNPFNRPLSVSFPFLHESMACCSWLRAKAISNTSWSFHILKYQRVDHHIKKVMINIDTTIYFLYGVTYGKIFMERWQKLIFLTIDCRLRVFHNNGDRYK